MDKEGINKQSRSNYDGYESEYFFPSEILEARNSGAIAN